MTRQIMDILSRTGPTMLEDALGLAALCVMLVVGLNLTGLM